LQEPGLFDFPSRDQSHPLLLIIDRADDPVTPLLTQWTYRAMVHELIGIHNHRVLINKPATQQQPQDGKKKESELILSVSSDPFYRDNMNKNFGELGVALKELVAEFKKKTQSVRASS
jgi:vacuolar protein sorting-associated protein 45